MKKNKKIGIIVADIDEFRPLAEKITKGAHVKETFLKRDKLSFMPDGFTQIIAIHCGIGKVNAAAAAAHLADIGCDAVFNYGLSGGISGVRRGDMFLGTEFLEHDFDLTMIGYKPCEKPGQTYIYKSDKRLNELVKSLMPDIKQGTAVSGDRFICSDADRNFFKDKFGAMSCDMETAAIAFVCEYASVPFACVRRISDDAGADAAESYREMNSSAETDLADFTLECACKAAEII